MPAGDKEMLYLSYHNTARYNLKPNNTGLGYSVDGVSGRGRMAPGDSTVNPSSGYVISLLGADFFPIDFLANQELAENFLNTPNHAGS